MGKNDSTRNTRALGGTSASEKLTLDAS